MRQKLVDLTGVIPVMTDMCFDLCVAFTGPFSELRTCPECSSAWYETVMQGNRRVSVPHKQALTIPVGPQIQAQYWSHEGMWNMGHQVCIMEPLLAKLQDGGSIETDHDVYCSSILINVARHGDLASDDVVLMLSVNCYDLSFALLHADTSDCFLSSLPHPLIGLLYFCDPILPPPVLYDIHLVLRYDLPCTIHIYEPLIRLLVVLGEFRFPST